MKLNKMKWMRIELIALTIVLAFCSIVYELLLSNTLALVTGSYVWWQSLTIGVYIGGLGVGAFLSEKITDSYKTLFNIELVLSLAGAICVVYVYIFHGMYKYFDNLLFYTNGEFYSSTYVQTQFVAKILFFVVIQSFTFVVGLCSGFEIPLLMKLSDIQLGLTEENEHQILAMNYLGTLVGTIFFAYLLLPKLDVVKTSIVVSLLNLLACIYVFVKYIQPKRKRHLFSLFLIFSIISIVSFNTDLITQRYLKFYYYLPRILAGENIDMSDVFRKIDNLESIERSKSHYQYVDIFKYPYKDGNDSVQSTILTLDLNFQFSTATEFYYHQAFAHVPVALNKKIPKKVLVLGGGDGLLDRELLKYDSIESIHHIELDKKMVDLANDRFSSLNQNALKNPRVKLEIGDGFYYLRNTKDKYDAIFIDFPYPNSYDLAKLYSVEFYQFVLRALNPEGFVVFDVPFYNKVTKDYEKNDRGMTQIFNERHLINNSIYTSTVYYAGFKTIHPYRVAEESFLFLKKEPGMIDYNFVDNLDSSRFSSKTLMEMKDLKHQNFPYKISPRFVNSIFRPTIAKKDDF